MIDEIQDDQHCHLRKRPDRQGGKGVFASSISFFVEYAFIALGEHWIIFSFFIRTTERTAIEGKEAKSLNTMTLIRKTANEKKCTVLSLPTQNRGVN